MRTVSVAGSIALLCVITSSAFAADLAVPAQREAVAQPQPTEVACLRWIEQTYSWYNYCDMIPYGGRHKQAQSFLGGY